MQLLASITKKKRKGVEEKKECRRTRKRTRNDIRKGVRKNTGREEGPGRYIIPADWLRGEAAAGRR